MNIGDIVQTDCYASGKYPGRLMRVEQIQEDIEAGRAILFGVVVRRNGIPGRQRLFFSEPSEKNHNHHQMENGHAESQEDQ